MKKTLISLCFAVLCIMAAQAKPIFTQAQYLIATLSNSATGVVSLGNATYPLTYSPDRNEENALATDFWKIINVSDTQYAFQNASTGQYIQYNSGAVSERSALVLVDALQPDNSTSFTLELKLVNGLCYYIIRSAVNNSKVWNKRNTAYNSLYPVGVYSGNGSDNELFVFYDLSGNAVTDETPVPLPNAGRTLDPFSPYLLSLTFDGKTPTVDKQSKKIYISIIPETMSESVSKTIQYVPVNTSYTLYINNVEVESGATFQFDNVTASTSFSVEIKNGNSSLMSGTLHFSCLPLVQLYSDGAIGTVYTLGRVAVTEPEKSDSTEVILTNVKTRGALSLSFDKKSFALNIRNSIGTDSDDRSFFSLRNDNNWILDAMYIDPARMRNRVSTDIWNSFSTKPYWAGDEPQMINGTRGRFVELFINDVYHGLYCMTEKIDRKQLKLKKLKSTTDANNQTIYTQRGTLFKAVGWSNAVLMGYPYGGKKTYSMYNNSNIAWNNYECKYPELDEGEPIMWDNLYKALLIPNEYYTSDADFNLKVGDVFDLPVYLDYYLLNDLMLATDNHGKNTYTSIYDQTVSNKVCITPWDMDGTWGIRWDGSKNITQPQQNLDTFLIENEHGQLNLYLRLKRQNVNSWQTQQLKERYLQLRGGAFSFDTIMNRFQTYASLFALSGADGREVDKWGQYGLVKNIASEMNYISDWLSQRLAFLDLQYLGEAYSGIADHKIGTTIQYGPNPVSDILMIKGLPGGSAISLYTFQGIMLEHTVSNGDDIQVNMTKYPAGIYIVRGESFFTKIVKK